MEKFSRHVVRQPSANRPRSFRHRSKRAKPDKKGALVVHGTPLSLTIPTTRTGHAALSADAKSAEICHRSRLSSQQFQPGTPPLRPRQFQGQPCCHSRRVASTWRSIKASFTVLAEIGSHDTPPRRLWSAGLLLRFCRRSRVCTYPTSCGFRSPQGVKLCPWFDESGKYHSDTNDIGAEGNGLHRASASIITRYNMSMDLLADQTLSFSGILACGSTLIGAPVFEGTQIFFNES